MRLDEEQRTVAGAKKSPTAIFNNLPLVASLLTLRFSPSTPRRLAQIMAGSDQDPTVARGITAWQLAFTALGCLAYTLVAEGPTAISDVIAAAQQSNDVLVGILYTAILGTSATIALQVEAFKRVPSTEASILLTTEPLIASAGSAIILSEVFDNWTAAAFIVAALVITFTRGNSDLTEE